MKILITGGNGYLGKHIVKKLLDLGNDVLIIDRNYENMDSRAKILNVDIFSDEIDIFEKVGRPDVCLHLAWKDGFKHNSLCHMQDLSKHFEFINNMVEGGLNHIAIMGSMHEVGYHVGKVDENTPTNPLSYYGIAKNSLRESTKLLAKSHGITWQWLRGYYIIGDDRNSSSLFTKICSMEEEGKESFPFVSGTREYDFIDIEDFATQVAYSIIQTEITDEINICSGVPTPIGEMVEEFIRMHEFKIKPEYNAFPERPYDSPTIYGDNTKILQILENKE